MCELVLVDICEKTDLRLMLPARTQLIENDALDKLKSAVEKEFYCHIQKLPHHKLYYSEYLRAMELGVELKEAKPVYTVGLGDGGFNASPADIMVPEKFDIRNGYLMPEIANFRKFLTHMPLDADVTFNILTNELTVNSEAAKGG